MLPRNAKTQSYPMLVTHQETVSNPSRKRISPEASTATDTFEHISLDPACFAASVTVKELDEIEARATCARYGIPIFWNAIRL